MKKRSDGRYLKQITDKRTGKRLTFYGHTQKEVNQRILEYTQEKESGAPFSKIADEWWATAYDNIAIQTAKGYKRARAVAMEYFGQTRITLITPKEIKTYLAILRQKGYAQKTITNYRLVLNLIFEYAVVEGYLQYNPCASVKPPKNGVKKERTSATPDEEETIAKSSDLWIYPVIALYTGMRKGEILALQWQDIDFDRNLIHVTKSVGHAGNHPFIKTPKTDAGIRTVPLLTKLKIILEKVPDRIPEHYIISLDGTHPLAEHEYQRLYNHFRAVTGISCTAHQLRHSFATRAFEADVPVKSVQEILGHRQLSTTMDIYTDFRKKAMDDAAQKLNNALH